MADEDALLDFSKAKIKKELGSLGKNISKIVPTVDQAAEAIIRDAPSLQEQTHALLHKYNLCDDDFILTVPSGFLNVAAMVARQTGDKTESFLVEQLEAVFRTCSAQLVFMPMEISPSDQASMIIGRAVHHCFLEVCDLVMRAATKAGMQVNDSELREAGYAITRHLITMNWQLSVAFA